MVSASGRPVSAGSGGMRPLSVRPHGFRLRPSSLRRLRRNDLRLKFDPTRPTGLPLCSAAFRCAALRRGAPTSRFRVGRSCVSAPFRSAPGKPGPPCSATCAACPCVSRAPSVTPAAAHALRSSPMRQGLRDSGRVLLFGAEGFGRESLSPFGCMSFGFFTPVVICVLRYCFFIIYRI